MCRKWKACTEYNKEDNKIKTQLVTLTYTMPAFDMDYYSKGDVVRVTTYNTPLDTVRAIENMLISNATGEYLSLINAGGYIKHIRATECDAGEYGIEKYVEVDKCTDC
jgi:hypothetical protein